MIDNRKVAEFFDRLSDGWDEKNVQNGEVIEKILDLAGIEAGTSVLDVGCGTGLLIPKYLERKTALVTAVDISRGMIAKAKAKYGKTGVLFLAADAAVYPYGRRFDRIVIYNAFPHFSDPPTLLAHLAQYLEEDGILTVAHGASRAVIDACHQSALEVSNALPDIDGLSRLLPDSLEVIRAISDGEKYVLTARRRKN